MIKKSSLALFVPFSMLGIACGLCLATVARGQEQTPRLIGGFPAQAPLLPERPPRPADGPDSVKAFVKSISSQTPDAEMEVVVGQSRLMHLKHPLAGPDQAAQISIGDPAIADVDVVSTKVLRIYGIGPGETDMMILIPKQEPLTIRIHGVWDLDPLRTAIKESFPDAGVRLRQMKEHILVDGLTRDPKQAAQILDLIRVYRESLQARQTGTR